MYPRSGFWYRGTSTCTLVPFFGAGEHPNVPNLGQPPFWKPPFCEPLKPPAKVQEWPRQTKPNQRKVGSWTFCRGIPEQKFNVNRACFPKEKHQNSQKRAKFMNFSFWPFLWFGLLGRLLNSFWKVDGLDPVIRIPARARGGESSKRERICRGRRERSARASPWPSTSAVHCSIVCEACFSFKKLMPNIKNGENGQSQAV